MKHVHKGACFCGAIEIEVTGRQFCKRCGGNLMTDHPGFALTDVYPAVIPTVPFLPSVHLNYAERVLPVRDGLPKLKDFPASVGGSGEAITE